jgi:hypothetical protein
MVKLLVELPFIVVVVFVLGKSLLLYENCEFDELETTLFKDV